MQFLINFMDIVKMRFLFTDVAFNESASKIISCVAFADVTDDSEIFKRKYFGQLVDFYFLSLYTYLNAKRAISNALICILDSSFDFIFDFYLCLNLKKVRVELDV